MPPPPPPPPYSDSNPGIRPDTSSTSLPWWRQFLPSFAFSSSSLSRSPTSSSSSSSSSTGSGSIHPPSRAPSPADDTLRPHPPEHTSTNSSNRPPTAQNTPVEPLPEWARVWDWNAYADVGAAVGIGSDSFGGGAVVRSRGEAERGGDGYGVVGERWMRRRGSVETLPAYEEFWALGVLEEPPAYEA